MTAPQDRTGAAWRTAEKARNRRRRTALWVVAVGLLLVLVFPALRRALSTPEPAPAELLGV